MEDHVDLETPDQQSPASDPEMRRRAEELLREQAAFAAAPASDELAAALHELRVHQIELEMQNEELRRAQLELEEQREKYFDLFHLAPVGYFTLIDRGMVGEANNTAALMLGVDRQLLVGQPFSTFVVAADRNAYYLFLGQLQKTGAPQTCELRLQPVGAEPLWAHLEGRPQTIAGGEPRQHHVTFTDVHERVLAAEALRESEEQLACAVDGSGVGLWDWYPQTGEETFSERWAEIAGYTLAELAPTSIETWRRLTHPEDLARADVLLEEHFARLSDIYACEARVRHKDGHWVWVLDRGKVSEWDADGRPLRMTGTELDITARKQAEEALRDATDRLALATHAGGVGVWDYLVTDDVLIWDDQMFALYGTTREQFSGAYEAWRAGLHPEDEQRGDAEIQMALRGEKEFDTDFRVLWPDGTVRIIRALALVQRDASGRPLRMIGTNRDITEFRQAETEIRRLQTEEALRQNEEAVLVAVAAERSRLARELHDSVTQALFAATLKSEALRQSVGAVTPQTEEMLADLHRLTRGALAEMRTLLLEMRPDALGEVPLDELLRHLAIACESRARITVSLTTSGRRELALDVKLALYRIAQEALNNVVRHAQATRAWLELRCSAATLQLVIGDDGCGFEPSRARPGQLGLRMMRERAGAAGALLRVETELGRGTLVTLTWPGGEE